MSLLLLAISFVFSGLNLVSNKALAELNLGAYRELYCLGFWGSGALLSWALYGLTRHRMRYRDAALGLVMGVAGAFSLLTLLAALETVEGVVAFPVRSSGNIALTAAVSYVAWRERLTPLQWTGVACAISAIYLLV